MDKLTLISGTLFIVADVLAIFSLLIPNWIVSDIGGETRLGLIHSCFTLYKRPTHCELTHFQIEWVITLVLIVIGCLCVTVTIILLILSNWSFTLVFYARWFGFLAMIAFCFAAVIFPIGFTQSSIGGEPYQLPSSHQVGVSYMLFVLSVWITVVSELFAGKVCTPHF